MTDNILTRLKKEPAIFSISKSVIITHHAPKGLSNINIASYFAGAKLPKQIVVGFVTSDAFNGSYVSKICYFNIILVRNILAAGCKSISLTTFQHQKRLFVGQWNAGSI